LAPKVRECAFNATGERVSAPFDFIDRLRLKDQNLKDNLTRQQELLENLRDNAPRERIDNV